MVEAVGLRIKKFGGRKQQVSSGFQTQNGKVITTAHGVVSDGSRYSKPTGNSFGSSTLKPHSTDQQNNLSAKDWLSSLKRPIGAANNLGGENRVLIEEVDTRTGQVLNTTGGTVQASDESLDIRQIKPDSPLTAAKKYEIANSSDQTTGRAKVENMFPGGKPVTEGALELTGQNGQGKDTDAAVNTSSNIKQGASGAPVVKNGKVVGIVRAGDLAGNSEIVSFKRPGVRKALSLTA